MSGGYLQHVVESDDPQEQLEFLPSTSRMCHCSTPDENTSVEWVWDGANKSAGTQIVPGSREVRFHVDYSNGTAAARGAVPMKSGQHYWEIKMVSPVYGTDMMIGIGTEEAKLDEHRHIFTSLLGRDKHSWGLSYFGSKQHAGRTEPFTRRFGEGSVIGVHLDLWHGVLTYYLNKQLIGEAYRGLRNGVYYPMVSSTAARSSMKITCAYSFNTSLQYLCCRMLRSLVPRGQHVLHVLALPPGLRTFLYNNLDWLLSPWGPQTGPQAPPPPPRVLVPHSSTTPQPVASTSDTHQPRPYSPPSLRHRPPTTRQLRHRQPQQRPRRPAADSTPTARKTRRLQ